MNYEELQAELQASLSQYAAREAKAMRVILNIQEILESHGFPKESISYRTNWDEPREQAFGIPNNKLDRRENGAFGLMMDIRVDPPAPERTKDGAILLGQKPRGGTCFTFVDIECRFFGPHPSQVEVVLAGGDWDSAHLVGEPETDKTRLSEFCEQVIAAVQATIQWVATGEGRRARSMGFHAGGS